MQQSLSEFIELLDVKIEETWSARIPKDHLMHLTESLQLLSDKAIEIGEKSERYVAVKSKDGHGHGHDHEAVEVSTEDAPILDAIKEDSLLEICEKTVVHYSWIKETKSLLVLWRDILFEFQKSYILSVENIVTDIDLFELIDRSKEKVLEAREYVDQYFDIQMKSLGSQSDQEDYLENQSLKTDPWPIYKSQIEDIKSQSDLMMVQHEQVLKTNEDLKSLTKDINEVASSLKTEILRIKSIGFQTQELINEQLNSAPQKIIKHIDSIDQQALAFNNYNAYNSKADVITAQMIEEIQVPTSVTQSQIEYKEINFSKVTKHWLEGEIQPVILEAQELLDGIGNSMKMALVNVRNRLALATSEGSEVAQLTNDAGEISQPIQIVIDIIEKKLESVVEFQEIIKTRLEDHLQISHVYDQEQSFLYSSQQYLIGQINLEQTAWVQDIKRWFVSKSTFLKSFLANVAQEESLSSAEKIVRYVKSRKIPDDNRHYSNIFAAQGFIGESFWVGRKTELAHMVQLMNNWRDGYRGSVVISGKRFSGKTVFGELIAHRYFPNTTIRLKPQTLIKIDGRTFETTEDLGAAIDFIKKNSITKSYLIWIDDLELWQSPTITSSENVKALLRHIDNLSSQLFFMVSMSNWFRYHYNQMFKSDKVFQAEINMDYMPEEEVRQAIIIRHGATHKLLVTEEGEQVPPPSFANMVQKVYRLAEQNIGQTLNLWTYFTESVDEDKVVHRPELSFELPDFINDENSILLKTILMEKRTNEYRLRKTLGSAFKLRYRAIVQRLINIGILHRQIDGHLEIDEGSVNDVALLLEKAGYINFRKR